MVKDIRVRCEYVEGRSRGFQFYRLLPGAYEVAGRPSEEPMTLGRNVTEALICMGGAILSSTTLAVAIKAYVEGKKRKITVLISGTEKKIEYEGSSFSADVNTIEAMIDKLLEETGNKPLTLEAESYETFDEMREAESWDYLSKLKGYLEQLEQSTKKQSSDEDSSD